jgi:hypothetical protein
MIIVVIMIMAMVFSVAMSGGLGLYGYNQGWFETDPPAPPPSTTKEDDKKDDDTKDDNKGPSTGVTVYLFSKECTAGDNWHRFIAAERQDTSRPWMHCKNDGGHAGWKLTKVDTWYYYIQNTKTKKYLTADGDTWIKISNKDGDKSKWAFKKQKDAAKEYAIRNKATGKVLNIHGNNCSDWQRSDVSGESVLRMDSTDDETNAPPSARFKVGTAKHTTPSQIVSSAQANCSNER